ncbi:SLC13 family permease [Legionella quateirensis]|uniref:inner membrane protein YbhI n=1 Tax=Legionella quateirensis TaxID=45072 RepID=A0A378KXZ4_9GAMM|nr:SLC13 family permease [Legionella quateirensis]KTD48294.1 Inner membrane protein YbhI [Legionella quateirensis]STY18377.1 Inner membrane protein ybhI [Legionella quateirensis]
MMLHHSRILLNKTRITASQNSVAVLGWLITILSSLIVFDITQNYAISLTYSKFSIILVAALVMWIFRLVPEYIPSLIIMITAMLLHIAPGTLILSGFNSDSFYFAVSVFSIGALLTKSRLFYRLSLIMLIKLPFKQAVLQKCLFFLGAFMTPMMSVQSSRVALIAPLLNDIMESSRIKPRSSSANALANSAFNGCILLSTIFLTGKSSNFIIYGLLSEQHQWQGNWFSWLWLASFPGLMLIAVFFILQSLLFKPNNTLNINRYKLKKELCSMGKTSLIEQVAIISFIVFFAGTILSTWCNISGLWTCLIIFIILYVTGALTSKEIHHKINWGFLFYFGAIIGVMRTIQSLGVDLWLINHFQWLTHLAQSNVACFIALIYAISWVGGLVLGTMIAPAILFTAIIPFALQSPVCNWIVAFVILLATEAWIFPYQSSYFLCFEELLKRKNNFLLKPLLKLNAWFTFLKLFVILASIPFWYSLGVLY